MAKSIYGKTLTPQTFHSGKSRRVQFIALLCITLFWNGLTWTMAYQILKDFGRFSIFPLLFMSIFLLIGLVLLAGVVHQFIALFNPTLEFELSPVPIRLGETITVTWSFTGRVDRIQRLNVYLEGREQSRYRRGTTTHTDTLTFLKLDVADTTITREIASGRTTFEIPAGTMHSFDGGDNKILWRFVVHGDIPGRPDVKDEIDVQILPQSIAGNAAAPAHEVPV